MNKKAKNERRDTLITTVIKRVGVIEGYRVLLFLASWGHASQKLGRPLDSVDEFAEWWLMSRSQAFRDQARYRKALPEFPDPNDACAWLRELDAEIFDGEPAVIAFRIGGLLS